MGDYTRFLEEEFPYYLALGMSPREYWEEDPALALAYVRAEQLRKQRTSDELWLLGAYVFEAVSVVAYNALRDKKKGQKAKGYLDEPWRVIPYTPAEEKQRARRERRRVIEFFDRMARQAKKQKER